MNMVKIPVLSKKCALLISLALSALMLVGCGGKDKKNNTVTSSSASSSHVFVPTSSALSSIAYLKASNTDANDWFGWSVAISGDGNTMAVGAPAEDSNALGVNASAANSSEGQYNNSVPNTGAVYIFVKVNGEWTQQAYLKASNTEQPNADSDLVLPNDRFGFKVALSDDGNTLAVSALLEDSPSAGVNCYQENYIGKKFASSTSSLKSFAKSYDIGAVYVFKRDNNEWQQKAFVKPFNPYTNLTFGFSLALSGDGKTLAVGTPVESTFGGGVVSRELSSGASSIAIECYNYNSSQASLEASSDQSSQQSSAQVSNPEPSSKTASSTIPGGQYSGAVYIYNEVNGVWIEDVGVKPTDADPGDSFGTSLSLSDDGNTLVVGSVGDDSENDKSTENIWLGDIGRYLNSGAVYVITRSDKIWTQAAKVKPVLSDTEFPYTYAQKFGESVAISGNGTTLAVGAPNNWSKNSGVNPTPFLPGDFLTGDFLYNTTGAAYLFTGGGSSWSQQAYIKSPFPYKDAEFGSTVALSKTGDILAVGAPGDSSQAKGINGDQEDHSLEKAGAAYLFTRAGNTWTQKSYIKAPNTHKQDRFGYSLGLDALGDILAVGAYREWSAATGVNGNKDDTSATAAGAVYIY
jgi:trimeric autotransporter adhesin